MGSCFISKMKIKLVWLDLDSSHNTWLLHFCSVWKAVKAYYDEQGEGGAI